MIADVQAVGKVHAAFVECLHGFVQLCTPLFVHMYVSVHMHEVVCVPVCVCPCLYASTLTYVPMCVPVCVCEYVRAFHLSGTSLA